MEHELPNWCCGSAEPAVSLRSFQSGEVLGQQRAQKRGFSEHCRKVIANMKRMTSRLHYCDGARRTLHGRIIVGHGALLMAFVVLATTGCMNSQNTRFPSLYTWMPSAENEAFERQDPFPDPDIGPSMHSTPRGYERPRSESRRAAEQRMFQGLPVGPENVRPGVPQGGQRNDRAVY